MTTQQLQKEIRKIARISVREALAEELMRFRGARLPTVSAVEQKDIESRYGAPSRSGARRTVRVRI